MADLFPLRPFPLMPSIMARRLADGNRELWLPMHIELRNCQSTSVLGQLKGLFVGGVR
jgi:hypothetical protein